MKTRITIILDKSGSMQSIKNDMEGGANSFINGLKNQDNTIHLSLYQFDSTCEKIYEELDINEAPQLSINPCGSTSLLDAVGDILSQYNFGCKNCEKDTKHLFLIITDGEENTSKRYTKTQVLNRINKMQRRGCEFVYIGSNQDAFHEANSIGIAKKWQYNNNAVSIRKMWDNVTVGAQCYSSSMQSGYEFKEEDDKRE